MPATPSTAQTYREAAQEHLLRAQKNFNTQEFFAAHYFSGLAVECHLRAYLRRLTSEFKSKHDLRDLAKEAEFLKIVPGDQAVEFAAKFSRLNQRWRSNHRYYSEKQFLEYLAGNGIKFDSENPKWEDLARDVIDLAYAIINQGEAKWDSK